MREEYKGVTVEKRKREYRMRKPTPLAPVLRVCGQAAVPRQRRGAVLRAEDVGGVEDGGPEGRVRGVLGRVRGDGGRRGEHHGADGCFWLGAGVCGCGGESAEHEEGREEGADVWHGGE